MIKFNNLDVFFKLFIHFYCLSTLIYYFIYYQLINQSLCVGRIQTLFSTVLHSLAENVNHDGSQLRPLISQNRTKS